MSKQSFSKPALSLEDQVALLQSRGLVVPDVALARDTLLRLNYYRFGGYALHFEIFKDRKRTHQFKPGTNFDDVLALYDFDTQLRALLFRYIEPVEVAFRTAVAHELAMRTKNPHWYLERNNISCRGATIYSTTFPCHNCAKHIIAAGITRVVYIEPYPKSKAFKFHPDAVFAGFRSEFANDHRVAFEPFVGVGPRRFFDLFSMKQGSGFPLRRKDKGTGKILPWDPLGGTIRMPMLPWNYLQREEFAVNILKPHLGGGYDGQRGADPCQAGPTEPSADDCGSAAGDCKC